jgi:actin related protein 2/3 complex subunit 2
VAYLSISIPPLCNGVLPNKVSPYTIEKVKGICPNLVEIEEPAREGFQLTLKLNLDQIPRNKGLFHLIHFLYGCHPSTQLNYNIIFT